MGPPPPPLPAPPAQDETLGLRRKHETQLMKTQMCKFFALGRCGKGTRCTFAHSINEMRGKPDLEKTSMCTVFLKTGNCRRPNCSYAHDERELRATDTFFKSKMCRFADSGRCRQGRECRFAHSVDELSPEGLRALARLEAGSNSEGGATSTSYTGTGTDHTGVGGVTDRARRLAADAGALSSCQDEEVGYRKEAARDNSNAGERRAGGLRGRACTTLLIMNVPDFLTQGSVVSLLEDLTLSMRGQFDFFYCPWNPEADTNLGYAIINFFSRTSAAEFESQWMGQSLLPPSAPGSKKLQILPASLQGRAANIRHFSGFALARQADPRFRPLVRGGPHEPLRPMALAEEIEGDLFRQRPVPPAREFVVEAPVERMPAPMPQRRQPPFARFSSFEPDDRLASMGMGDYVGGLSDMKADRFRGEYLVSHGG